MDKFPHAISLSAKRIVVTGGTTGIGRATVELLAREGARLLTCGRHQAELEASLQNVKGQGGEVQGLIADVATKEGVSNLFSTVDAQLGGLDALVVNAGVAAEPVQNSSDDDWRYAVETDFVAYLACAKGGIERLEKSGGGHIVFVGSVAADHKTKGHSVYAAAKAGVAAYAEVLRKEVAENNIRVTLIEPGATGANMQRSSPEEQRLKISEERMLLAEDIADAVRFSLTRPNRTNVVSMRVEPRLEEPS